MATSGACKQVLCHYKQGGKPLTDLLSLTSLMCLTGLCCVPGLNCVTALNSLAAIPESAGGGGKALKRQFHP